MKYLMTWILALCLISCVNNSTKESGTEGNPEASTADNPELESLFQKDQKDRTPENGEIDWDVVLVRDSMRLNRAYELVESGQLRTSKDYYHAATVFQHGYDTIASKLAVTCMKKAIELDSTINKWLLAAAIDRDLQRRGEPQIFGIQFTQNDKGIWELYEIDTTVVTDHERKLHNVPSLSNLREQAAKMNENK